MSGFIPMLMSSAASLAVALSSTMAQKLNGTSSTITSPTISATVTGGTAPYTYSWAVTTSDGIVALNPTSPSTAFRKTGASEEVTYEATAILTVTDNVGTVVASPMVTIRLRFLTGTGTL